MYRSSAYRKRLGLCSDILEVIRKTEIMIRYDGSDVYEIINELRAEQRYAESGIIPVDECTEGEFSTFMCGNVEKWIEAGEEQKIIRSFWSELGTTDSEGQLKMLAGLYERTSLLLEKRQAEYEKYGRLYRS